MFVKQLILCPMVEEGTGCGGIALTDARRKLRNQGIHTLFACAETKYIEYKLPFVMVASLPLSMVVEQSGEVGALGWLIYI